MTLYALCLNPLIKTIDKNISGIRYGKNQTRTAIVANADDVIIFLTRMEDIPKLEETLHRFQAAAGARINIMKSLTMALGNWNKSNTILNISYYNEVTILGYHFTKNINTAAAKTWSAVVARMRATAQDAYQRDLTLDKRIQFVQQHILAKIWYVTKISPHPPADAIRRLNTAIAWFIWHGEIFRVPLSTLQRETNDGGWNMYNAEAKCRALFMYRLKKQS